MPGRERELGFSYIDRINMNGPIFYALCDGLADEYFIRQTLVQSAAQNNDTAPAWHRFRLALHWFLSARWLQNGLDWFFLDKSDVQYLPKPLDYTPVKTTSIGFRIRHFLYAVFTLPLSLLNTVFNLMLFPRDSWKRWFSGEKRAEPMLVKLIQKKQADYRINQNKMLEPVRHLSVQGRELLSQCAAFSIESLSSQKNGMLSLILEGKNPEDLYNLYKEGKVTLNQVVGRLTKERRLEICLGNDDNTRAPLSTAIGFHARRDHKLAAALIKDFSNPELMQLMQINGETKWRMNPLLAALHHNDPAGIKMLVKNLTVEERIAIYSRLFRTETESDYLLTPLMHAVLYKHRVTIETHYFGDCFTEEESFGPTELVAALFVGLEKVDIMRVMDKLVEQLVGLKRHGESSDPLPVLALCNAFRDEPLKTYALFLRQDDLKRALWFDEKIVPCVGIKGLHSYAADGFTVALANGVDASQFTLEERLALLTGEKRRLVCSLGYFDEHLFDFTYLFQPDRTTTTRANNKLAAWLSGFTPAQIALALTPYGEQNTIRLSRGNRIIPDWIEEVMRVAQANVPVSNCHVVQYEGDGNHLSMQREQIPGQRNLSNVFANT